MQAGMEPEAAVQTFFLGVAAYSLWLHWFVARHGLALSRWRSAVLVVLVNGGTLVLAVGLALSFTVIGLFVATVGFAIGLDGGVFRTVSAVLLMMIGRIVFSSKLP